MVSAPSSWPRCLVVLATLMGMAQAACLRSISFQQGTDSGYGTYSGCLDTYIRSSSSSTNYATSTDLGVDSDPQQHTLIIFQDIFGTVFGRIPLGASITSSTLTFVQYDAGSSGWVSMMVASWAGSVSTITYSNARLNGNSASGLQEDNLEITTNSSYKVTLSGSTGTKNLDVLNIAKAWSGGVTNNGFAAKSTGNDGLDLRSSEYSTVSDRPKLTIQYDDDIAPVFYVRSISSSHSNSSYATGGNTVTLSLTASESVGTPTVTLNGHAASVSGSVNSYTATYVMDNGDGAGTITISVSGYSDTCSVAGATVTTTTDGSSVYYAPTTPAPTPSPTANPTLSPTASPTRAPTAAPTLSPTASPTPPPTAAPTLSPTASPTPPPTAVPTLSPTASPTPPPTAAPTTQPTREPTLSPTAAPTTEPTLTPTLPPTLAPTASPTSTPTLPPTAAPTISPSTPPTAAPTRAPTASPTLPPTLAPTLLPTSAPTLVPTLAPTTTPTLGPTLSPTLSPTTEPTQVPTIAPSLPPTLSPTNSPTLQPTLVPTNSPTLQPTLAPTPAPTPLPFLPQVRMADDGLHVLVAFPSSTDQGAGQGYTPSDCSSLFNSSQSFGVAATCSWPSAYVAQLALGTSATLLPGQLVNISGHGVRFAVNLSFPVFPITAPQPIPGRFYVLLPPLNPVHPVIALSAPQQVGSCNVLRADITVFSGLQDRTARVRWLWDGLVVSDSSNTSISSSLGSSVLTVSSDFLTLLVPVGSPLLLPLGSTHTVAVRVANFLGVETASSTVSVSRANASTPLLITTDTVRELTRALGHVIHAHTTVSPCFSATSLPTPVFLWEQLAGPTLPSTVNFNQRDLVLPAWSLEVGRNYTLVAKVFLSGYAAVSSSNVTFLVVPSSPVVIVDGGDRSVFATTTGGAISSVYSMSAASSFHPDDAVAFNPPPITGRGTLSWTCQVVAASFASSSPSCSIQGDATQQNITANLTAHIPAMSTTPSANVTYRVTVSFQDHDTSIAKVSSSVTLVVKVIASTLVLPEVSIERFPRALLAAKVPVQDTARFLATVSWEDGKDRNRSLVVASWRELSRGVAMTSNGLAGLFSVGTLLSGTSYTVQVSVQLAAQSEVVVTAQLAFTTNSVPDKGSVQCLQSPLTGWSWLTEFTVRCSGFRDADGDTLQYQFSLLKQDGSSVLLPGKEARPETSFLSGEGNWSVVVRAIDSLGDAVEYTLPSFRVNSSGIAQPGSLECQAFELTQQHLLPAVSLLDVARSLSVSQGVVQLINQAYTDANQLVNSGDSGAFSVTLPCNITSAALLSVLRSRESYVQLPLYKGSAQVRSDHVRIYLRLRVLETLRDFGVAVNRTYTPSHLLGIAQLLQDVSSISSEFNSTAFDLFRTSIASSLAVHQRFPLDSSGIQQEITALSNVLTHEQPCTRFAFVAQHVQGLLAVVQSSTLEGEQSVYVEDNVLVVSIRTTTDQRVQLSMPQYRLELDLPPRSTTGPLSSPQYVNVVRYSESLSPCIGSSQSATLVASLGGEQAGAIVSIDFFEGSVGGGNVNGNGAVQTTHDNATTPANSPFRFFLPLAPPDDGLDLTCVSAEDTAKATFFVNNRSTEVRYLRSSVSCSWYNHESGKWRSDGCSVVNASAQLYGTPVVECACWHFTDFAAIHDRQNPCVEVSLLGSTLYILFACLYALVCMAGARQLHRVARNRKLGANRLATAEHILLVTVSLLRVSNSLIYASGLSSMSLFVIAVLGALPYMLMYAMFSMVSLSWFRLWNRIRASKLAHVTGESWVFRHSLHILSNIGVAIGVLTIFLSAALVTNDDLRRRVALGGAMFMGILSLAVAVSFLVTSSMLIHKLDSIATQVRRGRRKTGKAKSGQRTGMTVRLFFFSVIFTVAFVGGGIIWFISVFDSVEFHRNFDAYTIVFFCLDLMSLCAILVMFNPVVRRLAGDEVTIMITTQAGPGRDNTSVGGDDSPRLRGLVVTSSSPPTPNGAKDKGRLSPLYRAKTFQRRTTSAPNTPKKNPPPITSSAPSTPVTLTPIPNVHRNWKAHPVEFTDTEMRLNGPGGSVKFATEDDAKEALSIRPSDLPELSLDMQYMAESTGAMDFHPEAQRYNPGQLSTMEMQTSEVFKPDLNEAFVPVNDRWVKRCRQLVNTGWGATQIREFLTALINSAEQGDLSEDVRAHFLSPKPTRRENVQLLVERYIAHFVPSAKSAAEVVPGSETAAGTGAGNKPEFNLRFAIARPAWLEQVKVLLSGQWSAEDTSVFLDTTIRGKVPTLVATQELAREHGLEPPESRDAIIAEVVRHYMHAAQNPLFGARARRQGAKPRGLRPVQPHYSIDSGVPTGAPPAPRSLSPHPPSSSSGSTSARASRPQPFRGLRAPLPPLPPSSSAPSSPVQSSSLSLTQLGVAPKSPVSLTAPAPLGAARGVSLTPLGPPKSPVSLTSPALAPPTGRASPRVRAAGLRSLPPLKTNKKATGDDLADEKE